MCAVDRDELARVLRPVVEHRRHYGLKSEDAKVYADALLSSGVLVDAADVRARARADWEVEVTSEFVATCPPEGDAPDYINTLARSMLDVRDRAVSEREGRTA